MENVVTILVGPRADGCLRSMRRVLLRKQRAAGTASDWCGRAREEPVRLGVDELDESLDSTDSIH